VKWFSFVLLGSLLMACAAEGATDPSTEVATSADEVETEETEEAERRTLETPTSWTSPRHGPTSSLRLGSLRLPRS
jgi:hypothetical protein